MARRLVAKTGTYPDGQGGTKNRWQNIGVIMSNDKGEYLLLDAGVSLAGLAMLQNQMTDKPRHNVMVSIFDDDNKQGGQQQQRQQQPQNNNQQQGDPFDEDTPF